ncbi:MAG: sugar phosphate isomerase/epimerase [Clostridia bacterium]|nr:sugar phosphate isomerase/epimerase [Clostridia bacterium]
MKISTQTGSFMKHFSDREIVDILKDAGFDAIDYSFFDVQRCNSDVSDSEYKQRFTELRKYAEDKGLYFNQSHAPHPSSLIDEDFTKRRFSELITALKNSSYLGVRNIIIHPLQHLRYYTGENTETLYEMNLEFYAKLIPYCEEYGITVCTENMFQAYGDSYKLWDSTCSKAEEFVRYVDGIGSPYVKACVDIGHTVLVGENPVKMIKALGHRVAALHVHDNDGIHDEHTVPFHGIIKWNEVAKALKDIGYSGEITLETEGFMNQYKIPKELVPASAKYMAETARLFSDMVINA